VPDSVSFRHNRHDFSRRRIPSFPRRTLRRGISGGCLTESVISALAASDPVAATDFLVNQCKGTSVEIGEGLWAEMSEFGRDIAAGLTSAEQCREVLAHLCQGKSVRGQQITLLENAALARWKRWDPAAATAWESSRSSRVREIAR
jgi:hypothetical protein